MRIKEALLVLIPRKFDSSICSKRMKEFFLLLSYYTLTQQDLAFIEKEILDYIEKRERRMRNYYRSLETQNYL